MFDVVFTSDRPLLCTPSISKLLVLRICLISLFVAKENSQQYLNFQKGSMSISFVWMAAGSMTQML